MNEGVIFIFVLAYALLNIIWGVRLYNSWGKGTDVNIKSKRFLLILKFITFPVTIIVYTRNKTSRKQLRALWTAPPGLVYNEKLNSAVTLKHCVYNLYYQDEDGCWTYNTSHTTYQYDMMYRTGTGQLITTHDEEVCKGSHCPIHNPSDHHMKDWPTNWQSDKGMMERMCEHGIGHPDPDDYYVKQDKWLSVHGCDGCCNPRTENKIKSSKLILPAVTHEYLDV